MLARYLKDESGAMIVEYGLIVSIIAISVIGGSMMIGSNINEKFVDLADTIGLLPK